MKPDRSESTPADPAMQGEGNYTAARRHRKSVEKFVEQGRVEGAADAAQPADADEAQALREAEQKGRSKARR
jgi:hypothetical protein